MTFEDVVSVLEQHGYEADDAFRITFTQQGVEVWEFVRAEDGSMKEDNRGAPMIRVNRVLFEKLNAV